MILEKWHSIFIHVPRTGGGSMETTLLRSYFNKQRIQANDPDRKKLLERNGKWTQHNTIAETVDDFEINEKDYFKFCFVRNPWDKAVSEFLYLHKMDGCHCKIKELPSLFRDFVKNKMFHCCWENHWLPQYDFIINKEGHRAMDFIGRFESLQEDSAKLLSKFGINSPLCNFNSTRWNTKRIRGFYKNFYDEESKKDISKTFEKDIDYFKYTF